MTKRNIHIYIYINKTKNTKNLTYKQKNKVRLIKQDGLVCRLIRVSQFGDGDMYVGHTRQ